VVGIGDYSHVRFNEEEDDVGHAGHIAGGGANGPYAGYRPAKTPQRTMASMRCRSSAIVKPHQALDA